MDVLRNPVRAAEKALGIQKKEDGITYRKSKFVISDGDAKYNTLTGEALYQSDEDTLIERWFMVPEDMDETSLAYLIRQRNLINTSGPGTDLKVKFVIFTTTACNADCIYCYEKGVKVMNMKADTAQDVAEYIMTHTNPDAEFRIRWFGGDPLMNIPVINSISNTLNQEGRTFVSEIFTNGDRLDEVDDTTLKDLWHVDYIQLTADDVGEEYERIKGLPAGAYERLVATVQRLTTEGIKVNLRVHYHPGKGADAPKRVVDAFRGYDNITIYTVMLYDGGDDADYEGLLEVQDYIMSTGKKKYPFPQVRIGVSCMAENRKIACITPDGHLSPCEHFPYGEDYGSIYQKGYDLEVLKRWSDKSKNHCEKCVLYPSCEKNVLCPPEGNCSPAEIRYKVERIKRAMRARI